MESWAIIPIVAIVMWGMINIARVRAHALRRGERAPGADDRLAGEIDDLRRRVAELEERQDFTERMLTQGRAGPGAD